MTNLRSKYWQAVVVNGYGVHKIIGFYVCRNSARNAIRSFMLKHDKLGYSSLIRQFDLVDETSFIRQEE